MILRQVVLFLLAFAFTSIINAQSKTDASDSLTAVLSLNYLDKIDNKISNLDKSINYLNTLLLL